MNNIPLIAISSSKSGVGKTTLTFNLALALLQDGYKVGIYSDFMEEFLKKRTELAHKNKTLKMPCVISKEDLFHKNFSDCSVVIADIPSSENNNFIPIFSAAHTLITLIQNQQDINWQLNDPYLNTIWTAKKNQAAAGIKYMNWVVVANQPESLTEDFAEQLNKQSRHFGFRSQPILEKRDVYTHIQNGYGSGDLISSDILKMSMSDVYARREILVLADFLWQHK